MSRIKFSITITPIIDLTFFNPTSSLELPIKWIIHSIRKYGKKSLKMITEISLSIILTDLLLLIFRH